MRFPADAAVLQCLLTRALPPFGVQGAGGSMTVRRAADPLPLVVHILPIGRPETAAYTGRWPCWWSTRRAGRGSIRRWWRRALASPRWRAGGAVGRGQEPA